MKKLNPKAVREAIAGTLANLTQAAAKLHVSRAALVRYVARQPQLQRYIDDVRNEIIDNAESALRVGIAKGTAWAVTFVLKTRGANLGYVEPAKPAESADVPSSTGGTPQLRRLNDEQLKQLEELLAIAEGCPTGNRLAQSAAVHPMDEARLYSRPAAQDPLSPVG
jgi:hypothetical protein